MAHSIAPLTEVHDVQGFDCGDDALNVWLQRTARQHLKNSISRTFVLTESSNPARIVGFYALAICPMTPRDQLPLELAHRLPRELPGYTLGRLAICKDEQRKGHGELLLADAMKRVQLSATQVGGYAFFVDAKDADASAFYEQFGFVPLVSDPLTLFMPIKQFPST